MASGFTMVPGPTRDSYAKGGKSRPVKNGAHVNFAEGGAVPPLGSGVRDDDIARLRRRLDIKTQGMAPGVREGVADKAQADLLRKALK